MVAQSWRLDFPERLRRSAKGSVKTPKNSAVQGMFARCAGLPVQAFAPWRQVFFRLDKLFVQERLDS